MKFGILGIASKFSIFAKKDVTLKAADTNGKIAVGGKLEATTDYEYQVGCEFANKKNSNEAKIVCEKGIIKNIDLDYSWNNETNELEYSSKYVAISSDFDYEKSRKTKFDSTIQKKEVVEYSNLYPTSEEVVMKYNEYRFKEANLFKFNNEFEYLKQKSNELVNLNTLDYLKGTEVNTGKIILNNKGNEIDSIIFKGENEKLNVFNITASEFNNLVKATGAKRVLTFDVPTESYVIVNITGTNQVDFDGSQLNVYYPMSEIEKDLYDREMDDIGYLENNEKAFRRISSGTNNDINVETNDIQAKHILYNVPEAESFTINSNWIGTILAPNANGYDNGLNGTPECGGHLSGIMICNSYEGYEQFGYVPFDLSLANINVDKIEGEKREKLPGAELAIYYFKSDENGEIVCNDENLVCKWTTTEQTKNILLPAGGYILKEINPPVQYERQDNKYYIFEVKEVMNYSGNETEYGTFSFENIVSEGHEYIKEEATYSTESNMWTPVTKSLHIAINMVNYVRV